jgi:hypothetical protein
MHPKRIVPLQTAHRHASTDDQRRARTPGTLGKQCRLADPRVSADQQHRSTFDPGVLDGALERRQLNTAPDEIGR